jgi:hypothetical protein
MEIPFPEMTRSCAQLWYYDDHGFSNFTAILPYQQYAKSKFVRKYYRKSRIKFCRISVPHGKNYSKSCQQSKKSSALIGDQNSNIKY